MAEPQYTEQQKKNMKAWTDLQETLNRGDFGDAMDAFFHPDFTYGNPSRPDLGSYKSWKTSPMELYKRLPPSRYSTKDMVAKGDDVWAYCTHHCVHTGGRYMGIEPTGNTFDVEWFSIVTFKDSKILRIFSIADVLGMFISVGVLDKSLLPTDPYR